MLVPDYGNPILISAEESTNNNSGIGFLSLQYGIGGWASKEEHYYIKSAYYDSNGNYRFKFTPNENLSYIIPSSGYINVYLNYAPWYRFVLTYSDKPIIFWVALVRDGKETDIISFSIASNELDAPKTSISQIPVRKGDKIYWGGLLGIGTTLPQNNICEYSIKFYPALAITAGSE